MTMSSSYLIKLSVLLLLSISAVAATEGSLRADGKAEEKQLTQQQQEGVRALQGVPTNDGGIPCEHACALERFEDPADTTQCVDECTAEYYSLLGGIPSTRGGIACDHYCEQQNFALPEETEMCESDCTEEYYLRKECADSRRCRNKYGKRLKSCLWNCVQCLKECDLLNTECPRNECLLPWTPYD